MAKNQAATNPNPRPLLEALVLLIAGMPPAGSTAQSGEILQFGEMTVAPRNTTYAREKTSYRLSAELELRIILLDVGRSSL